MGVHVRGVRFCGSSSNWRQAPGLPDLGARFRRFSVSCGQERRCVISGRYSMSTGWPWRISVIRMPRRSLARSARLARHWYNAWVSLLAGYRARSDHGGRRDGGLLRDAESGDLQGGAGWVGLPGHHLIRPPETASFLSPASGQGEPAPRGPIAGTGRARAPEPALRVLVFSPYGPGVDEGVEFHRRPS